MRSRSLLVAAFAVVFAFTLSATAQEDGPWRAASTNARAITGRYRLLSTKVHHQLHHFHHQPRSVRSKLRRSSRSSTPISPRAAAISSASTFQPIRRFLHKNTLCGSESTQWIVTYAQGRSLQVALFSGSTPPVLTVDALNDPSNLCGIFSYVR